MTGSAAPRHGTSTSSLIPAASLHWSFFRRSRVLLQGLAFILPARADCPCGPLYCVDALGSSSALAAKKKSLSDQHYPQRFIAIAWTIARRM
jgi:hypothetical protein